MKKSRIQLIAVLLILFIFPFMSWYYLRSGMDYRIEAISELEEIGVFSIEGSYDFRDRYIDPSVFEDKFIVAGFVPTDESYFELFSSRYVGLIEQFSSRDEVIYLNIINSSIVHSTQDVANSLYESYPGTVANHLILAFDSEEIEEMKELWKIDEYELITPFDDALFLIGRNAKIIQAYNYKDENRVGRLVEHLSMQFTGSQNRRDYSDAIRQKL
ncbi:MAG: hypothetical protein EA362_03080 [Saprospirales bacterium]|nr:MAG: hypothetical protein EA362_03080 [Saprospirales bacterium]